MLSYQENARSIFRLSAILCLVFLIMPSPIKNKQEPSPAEYGIGGGILYEETAETFLSLNSWDDTQALESAALDTESLIKSRILFYDSHTVKSGDNISGLAVNFGLNQDTIISINKITNSRLLQIGKVLKIPNQDGILHTVKNGETIGSIAGKYNADVKTIQTINELFSENIIAGKDLFIPGAKLDWVSLQEINGDLFIWPVYGAITSPYGYRRAPFNSSRNQFHTGIDIRGSMGTPVKAAMSGRVSQTGTDNVLGNYVIISHHSGYRTLYGHLSVIRARTGAYVSQGELIGNVGSTGLSTGPHLHFTVYKDGVLVNPRTLMR
jgi:murein DD-endopeptidase MepM/ murein hydrolase activator NlpD